MDRVASSTSSASAEKVPGIPSVEDLYTPEIEESQLYWYTLKLLIFEYINEPRFLTTSTNRDGTRSSFDKSHNVRMASDSPDRNSSGSDGSSRSDDQMVLRSLKGKLEVYLRDITMGKIRLSNQDYRRSLMKYYNDYFLNPSLRTNMIECKRPEDMIVFFSKTANAQLNKFNNSHVQNELYAEISLFVALMISLVTDTASEPFVRRLRDFENVLKANGASNTNKRISSLGLPSTDLNYNAPFSLRGVANTPTFRLEQITHATYFAGIFDVDGLSLQQDIIKVSKSVKNEIYCKELRHLYNRVSSDNGPLEINDFPSD